jgi:hypothetical protein
MRFTLVALALALAACSSDPAPSPACTPGAQIACACVGGAQGAQACAADGSGYGACVCPDAGAGGDVEVVDVPLVVDAAAPDAGELDAGAVDATVDATSDVSSEPGDDASPPDDSDTADTADTADAVDATDAPEVGIACPMGLGDCDGNPANGCEVDLRNNPAHCGGCGAVCRGGPNATTACRSGMCGETRCNPGRGDCNNDLTDGCEVNITTDTRHCGGCGRACSATDGGRVVCMSGSCRSV